MKKVDRRQETARRPLADPALYNGSTDNAQIQTLLKRQGELTTLIDDSELRWLEIHTELEEIGEV